MRRPQRRFANQLSEAGLDRVRTLLRSATAIDKSVPTQALLGAAGMRADPKTGLGALKMAEVLRLVRSERGRRKSLHWRAGKPASRNGRDPKLWDRLPYQRLRDLLQYYRGSLIGTPDLVRDAGLPSHREALGALKALLVLGHVESGHLDPQTVAWRWVSGRGQSRVYQRGYFKRLEMPLELDRPEADQGEPGWAWLDDLQYREWQAQQDRDTGLPLATDGFTRYRAPTVETNDLAELVASTLAVMPPSQRAATTLTLLNGLQVTEAARLLGINASRVGRLAETGLGELRRALTEAGLAPAIQSLAEGADLALSA